MHYVLLLIGVIAIDLIPAFGPPAWLLAVFFRYKYHLAFLPVVIITALGATVGRTLLAIITRKSKRYIPPKYIDNLEYSKRLLSKNRRGAGLAIGLFLFSPLPSAQLFEAAGLLDVPLLPLSAAFFVGRLITTSLYLGIAHITYTSLSRLLESQLGSVWAVVFEILCIMAILAMLNIRQIVQFLDRRKQNRRRPR